MSDAQDIRPIPGPGRSGDPAGTGPRHDPRDLLPARRAVLPDEIEDANVVEGDAVDVTDGEPDPAGAPDDEHHELLPERVAAAGAPALSAAAAPHASRFQFLAGALVAIGAAAVVLAVGFVVGGAGGRAGSSGPAWSAWHPSSSAAAAQQIADYVGQQYHLHDGRQLVLAQGGPLKVAGLPLTVALRETAAQGGDIKLYDDKGVLFRMCGLGRNCAIAEGKPSVERHLLLRREALELALYAFRYMDGVKQIAVLLPPAPGKLPSQAVFFRREELAPELRRPLDTTLTAEAPTVRTMTRSPDALLVDQLTLPTLFKFSLTQANQDDRAFLVLDPFTAASGSSSGSRGTSGSSNSSGG
ncbi:MAG TPA: hypothetical protein VMT10_08690 [Solirubrobacteraceae bacterium]|nr:hypothetical protein [Solirubrobacteraceae bacterium]